MERQERRLAKKARGRPATGRGTTVGVRCQDDMLEAVDDWRRKQPGVPTRATAIRRLAEMGLLAFTGSADVRAERMLKAKK